MPVNCADLAVFSGADVNVDLESWSWAGENGHSPPINTKERAGVHEMI